MLTICACASIFDKQYYQVEDYVYPVSNDKIDGKTKVKNLNELKDAITEIVDNGLTEGQIVFAEEYIGNITDDINNAVWQVRSQNALCAYCVDDISYELSKLISYYEVEFNVKYTDIGISFEDIHRLTYSTGLKDIIYTAINNLDKKIVLLINKSSYSSTALENLIIETYRQNPLICPVEPSLNIRMFSGNNAQRLYEIELNYGMNYDDLVHCKEELNNISLFSEEEMNMSDIDKAKVVFERLSDVEMGEGNSVYNAIIEKCSNSEGVALAFCALSNAIGLDCVEVYGNNSFGDYCWNIVKIDSDYFHVNVFDGISAGFLKSDLEMWPYYRWDTYQYPKCSVTLELDFSQDSTNLVTGSYLNA